MESRIIELEIQMAHQEVTLQELNGVIVRQQQIIERITRELELVKEQVRVLTCADVVSPNEEGPPPHY